MDRRTELRLSPATLALLLLLVFLGGVFLDRYNLLPGSTSAPLGVGQTFEPFWEAWRLVERHYVDRAAVRPETMTQGAIRGMLGALATAGHTTYLTPAESEVLFSDMEGKLDGIGALMTLRKNRPAVLQTLPNSPARAAGLKPDDVLLQVDGKAVTGLSIEQIATLVRGPTGTKVKLRVAREGEAKPLDFEITRAKIDRPVVSWAVLPQEPIAHLALREFGRQADTQLREALKEARERGVRGLILDVRGNAGGLKDQAVAVTSEFLKEGNVFLEKDAAGHETAIAVREGGVALDFPLVLLVDEGSASSAEIFAGALQDHKRGKLVGTQTFGTGTVLQPFELGDGSTVLLAVREWFTPDGRQIWHTGIAPDVEVKLPEGASALLPEEEANLTPAELNRSQDVQLLMALDIMRQELRKAGVAPAAKKAS